MDKLKQVNTVTKLVLIAKKAKEERKAKFSRLMYLFNEDYLYECFKMLKKGKAAGVDGRKLESYKEEEIKEAIAKMINDLKTRQYQPQPVRRVYIKKDNGKLRPLGIPTVVDKILQLGMTRILESIYEQDFLPSSYGYREGKDAHACLKEINHMIMGKKVNYIIDADIEGFFDNLNHKWLMKCISERISDPHFKRLIWKLLKSGVIEEGKLHRTSKGSPQGGIISPVLANIYLHYVLDLYFEKQLKQDLTGYTQLVRYADDFIIGVQHKHEAVEIMTSLEERLKKFGLTLSRDKTALKEFGRFAIENRDRREEKKPETFDFLGFTHYCSKTRDGRFQVRVKTSKKRLNKAVTAIGTFLKNNRTKQIKDIWDNLSLKLTGHYNYYGLSGNFGEIKRYYEATIALIFKWLNRRGGQRRSFSWEGFGQYLSFNPLPKPKLTYAIYNTW